MDEKQLLALLIENAEEQSAENAARLAALAVATEKIEGIIPAIQKAACEAIGVEARATLAGATTEATEAAGVLKRATQWFGWKVFALAIAGMAGVCLVAWGSIWWPRHQITALTEQKAALQEEVAELQTNVATLEKKGGKMKTSKCGPKGIFCVEVEPQRFEGQGSDSGKIFMIPKRD